MRELPALVQRAIAARFGPQTQERREQVAGDEARASGQHLAVVDQLSLWQRVLDVPRHHDRAVVLDMLGDRRLPLSLDRLAQARQSQTGCEGRAEAHLFDKAERGALAADAAKMHAAEVM